MAMAVRPVQQMAGEVDEWYWESVPDEVQDD